MAELLVSLSKSLGAAGLAMGIMFLLYRQLLGLGIFPKLSRAQAFTLLLAATAAVFAVVLMLIWPFGPRRLPELAVAAYACSTPDRPRFACRVADGEDGARRLLFEGPAAAGLIDQYEGAIVADERLYRVSVVSTFNPDPDAPEAAKRQTSSIVLSPVGGSRLEGTWRFPDGTTRPFAME